MEGVVVPSDMGVRSERPAKTNTLLKISGGTQLIWPGMRMGGPRWVQNLSWRARMARDRIFSMIGCVVHDRKISTSGVFDESMVGISPGYITVKLKKMGEGLGRSQSSS